MPDKLFKSIGEVAKELDIQPHILRFWEDNFKMIRPVRRTGGRRYYHIRDVEILHKIKDLLYKQGYTIKGAQKFLRQEIVSIPSQSTGLKNFSEQPIVQTTSKQTNELRNLLSSILMDLKMLRKTSAD